MSDALKKNPQYTCRIINEHVNIHRIHQSTDAKCSLVDALTSCTHELKELAGRAACRQVAAHLPKPVLSADLRLQPLTRAALEITEGC